MGPTNLALRELYQADRALREAQDRLDSATKSLRVQRKRVELAETAAAEARAASMAARGDHDRADLDLKTRDERITTLRDQQQNAKDNKEYQAFLVEINTQKADRAAIEERVLTAMQEAETHQAAHAAATARLAEEKQKLADLEAHNADRVSELEAAVAEKQPARDEAAEATPPRARELFERLADRYDGEGMAPLEMPDARRMEYFCGACNRELMVDAYNRLITRDEPVSCPSCDRLLFVPHGLTPEQAVPKKAKRSASTRKKAAKKAAKPTASTVKPLLSTASAESLREAEVAGRDSVTCEVSFDGKAAGEWEALSVADFEKRVRAKMQAQDIEGALLVTSRNAPEPAPAEATPAA